MWGSEAICLRQEVEDQSGVRTEKVEQRILAVKLLGASLCIGESPDVHLSSAPRRGGMSKYLAGMV